MREESLRISVIKKYRVPTLHVILLLLRAFRRGFGLLVGFSVVFVGVFFGSRSAP